MTILQPKFTVERFFNDPNLAGNLFPDPDWANWKIVAKAIQSEPLNHKERAFLRKITARKWERKETTLENEPFKEILAVIGRRGGKTRFASGFGCYRALAYDYTPLLAPGERASLPIICADRQQARVGHNYIYGMLTSIPMFEAYIENVTKDRIELKNRVTIEIITASHRTVRGRSVIMVIMDEAAFFHAEGAKPDVEIYRALLPAMANISSGLIFVISSPYSQIGLVYDIYNRTYGAEDSKTLTIQAESTLMNPTLDEEVVTKALKDDPEAAEAEFLAKFRRDLSTFLSIQVIENCIIKNRFELPFVPNTHYLAFCDPAGGGGQDSMSLAISHKEDREHGEVLVLDLIRAVRPPFNPYRVAADFAQVLREYHISEVTGDRYAGDWPSSAFAQHGIRYHASPMVKSDIYLTSEPLFSRGQIELLDNKRLFNELRSLERRTRKMGKDIVDHPLRGSDDVANSVCGSLVLANQSAAGRVRTYDWLRFSRVQNA